jgi:hypothetical protein
MAVFGKNIRLFLVDGTPNGRWICELSNWTGIAYKIPRNHIKESIERAELASPGIYFLFGKDEIEENRPLVYIGEAENIISRLKQHLDGKDYWNEAIIFISKDDNLNKAHIKFLENRFHSIALEAKRYIVKNSTTPTKSTISEAEEAEMEEFIHNAKILVNTLGHKVFETIVEIAQGVGDELNYLCIKVAGLQATGLVTADGFVVLKGSTIHQNTAKKSLTPGMLRLIEKYKNDGSVIDSIVQEDILFSSSSAAADFVLGYNVSGPKTWKNNQGKSLKEMESQ